MFDASVCATDSRQACSRFLTGFDIRETRPRQTNVEKTPVVEDAWRTWKQHRELLLRLSYAPAEVKADFEIAVVWLAVELTKVALFVMTLSYFGAIFLQAFPGECTEAFLDDHPRPFEFHGDVPTRLNDDDSKIAVKHTVLRAMQIGTTKCDFGNNCRNSTCRFMINRLTCHPAGLVPDCSLM